MAAPEDEPPSMDNWYGRAPRRSRACMACALKMPLLILGVRTVAWLHVSGSQMWHHGSRYFTTLTEEVAVSQAS